VIAARGVARRERAATRVERGSETGASGQALMARWGAVGTVGHRPWPLVAERHAVRTSRRSRAVAACWHRAWERCGCALRPTLAGGLKLRRQPTSMLFPLFFELFFNSSTKSCF